MTMSLSTKVFTIGVADPSELTSRASRRILIQADVLKAAKIIAGDVLALSTANSIQEPKVILSLRS